MDYEKKFWRLFYESAKNEEWVCGDDRRLLKAVGIHTEPFFKFTKGANTVVVYAYKEGEERYVVRFRKPTHPDLNLKMSEKLTSKGFCVAKFHGIQDICNKKIKYCNIPLDRYDKAEWVGYDFEVQLRAAAKLFKEAGGFEQEKGVAAKEIIESVGLKSGNLFGKLYLQGMRYKDFRPINLAGKENVLFFDIHGTNFETTNKVDSHLESVNSFFREAQGMLKRAGVERRGDFLTLLKQAFLEGLKQSPIKAGFIKKVEQNISLWG